MGYTLGQAAKHAKKAKGTISKAIGSGALSAVRNDDGSYDIDPSELGRWMEAVSGNSRETIHEVRTETLAETHKETSALQVEVDVLRQQIDLLKDERDDLRRRLDTESEERRRLTALLTDQRPPRRSWWPFGKGS